MIKIPFVLPYTQNKAAKRIFVQEKKLIWLTFKPGLALISFRAILPCFQQVNQT